MAGCCGNRCTTLIVAIYSMVISAAYIIFSIFLLMGYNCQISGTIDFSQGISAGQGVFVIFGVYLFNPGCSGINITLPNEWDQFGVTPPSENAVADMTNQWALAYMVLSCLWLVSSFTLLFNICKCQSVFVYVIWLVIAFANIIIDLAASIVFGLHIDQTKTPSMLLQFIGYNGLEQNEIDIIDKGSEAYMTSIPSIGMTILFSRGILFWIINVICAICMIFVTKSSRIENKKKEAKSNQRHLESTRSTDESQRARAPRSPEAFEMKPVPVIPVEPPTKKSKPKPKPKPAPLVLDARTLPGSMERSPQNILGHNPNEDAYYISDEAIPSPPPYRGAQNKKYVERNAEYPPHYLDLTNEPVSPVEYDGGPRKQRSVKDGKSTFVRRRDTIEKRAQRNANSRFSEDAELRNNKPWSYLAPLGPQPNFKPVRSVDDDGRPVYDGNFNVTNPGPRYQ